MTELKGVLPWTITQVAAIRQRLMIAETGPLDARFPAALDAIRDLGSITEELARHVDLLEQDREPWLKPGPGK